MADLASVLRNVRVLDLSTLLPGPFCTMLLADFGADVIKVEKPDGGDPLREAFLGEGRTDPAFLALNRGKRSVALNLRHPQGREAFLRLVQSADVLLEQFRPGVMARLGLDYETLRAVNPRLVYCSLSGYGQTGPYFRLPGHDLNFIALAGVLGLMGTPVPPGTQIADITGGLMACVGILLALLERQQSGQGQWVDVSLLDSALSTLALPLARHLGLGRAAVPGGEQLTGGSPCYDVYVTADGRHITLGALEEKFWAAFCRAVGREDWIPLHSATGPERERLRAELRDLFRTRTLDQWLADMQGVDTCLMPVLHLEEVASDPQVAHREMVVEGPSPDGGTSPMTGIPIKLSRTPGRIDRPAPLLGEHTLEVLREVGYTEDEVLALRESGAVAWANTGPAQ
ncbi:MAG TPA: CaiB/BaiF CoA-transferase family protein [Symbiobacteriaceae bacterium]